MVLECPSCSAQLAPDARFCQRCGAVIAVAPAEPLDPLRESLKLALGRQYEVSRLLGKGGMGAVYLAREAALDRDVAIKVLPPDIGATEESRDRFRREARTAAKLSHPNIVPLHTFGDVFGTLYFVMGYVKGESLAARLKREGKLPVEEARRILIEVVEALEYAHKLGIVHRDIKPDNVLIEEATGRALLTDFGIAKAVGAGQTMTTAGSVLGTPHYMSPEQAQGRADIDARSDLYSLGVMGYAMLAGRLPFEGSTPGDVMVQHITKEPPSLASLVSGVPPEITTALTRCLAKNPDERFRDATGLRTSLGLIDEEETPQTLTGLSDLFWMIAGAIFILFLFASWWLGGGDVSDPFPVLPLVLGSGTTIMALTLAWNARRARAKGFEAHRVIHEILRKPDGWPGWYPRRFRRSTDVWDRLPADLKRARAIMGWIFVAQTLTVPPMIVFGQAFNSHVLRTGRFPYASRPEFDGATFPYLALLGVAVFLVSRWQKLARANGLDKETINLTLLGPTTKKALWSRPEVAALLLPEGSGLRRGGEPATAAGLAAEVGVIARALPSPSRELGERAHAAARGLADSIDNLDRQIAGLAQALDPAESRRIADKIAALGPGEDPADVNHDLREILGRQLETLRSLEARIEEAKGRRAMRFELLKALRLRTLELQAAAGDPAKAGHTTDRILGLFRDIEHQTQALLPSTGNSATHPLADLPTMER